MQTTSSSSTMGFFVSCARSPQGAAWAASGVVAFGAANTVALWRPTNGVHGRLHGHNARVNCVCALRGGAALLSGSSDHAVAVWALQEDGEYRRAQMLTGHTDAVLQLAALERADAACVVASVSADATLRVWTGAIGSLACTQVMQFGSRIPLSLAMARLFDTQDLVLAVGLSDWSVAIYTQDSAQQFVLAATLKGHEDWVRSLAFASFSDDEMALASASQDKYIRLWQIRRSTAAAVEAASAQKAADRPSARDLLDALTSAGISLKNKAVYFAAAGNVYAVVMDALLIGHEDWVYSVTFEPPQAGSAHSRRCLLSASMDKTMMLWRPHAESGIWSNEVRVGEVGGQNVLGFYGGLFAPDASMILAHAFNGAFHLWRKQDTTWIPVPVPSGHFAAVNDVTWDPSGRYIVSVSDDQTARLFGPYVQDPAQPATWYELARPQVHGYDVQCVAFTKPHQFVSGADEKVVRVFDAPKTFVESFVAISKSELLPADREAIARGGQLLSATTPSLGLSNKPVFADNIPDDDENAPIDTSAPLVPKQTPSSLLLAAPPLEEDLMQGTLWAETEKLYGHPYEIFCCAADRGGRVVATASKASQPEHAVVRLWASDRGFRPCGTLAAHTLTVTQLVFSHDDRLLLSVSRDRGFAVFRRVADAAAACPFEAVARQPKAHSRIVWSGSFTHDDAFFVTCSRDKTVKFWSTSKLGDRMAPEATLELDDSVTAVAAAPQLLPSGDYAVLAGLENGALLMLHGRDARWAVLRRLNDRWHHSGTVRRIAWRPASWLVATAGADHAVHLFDAASA